MIPSAQGTLDKRPVAHLLLYAMERRLTGTLAFSDQLGASLGSIVVADGWPSKGDVEALFDLPDETQFAYFDQHDALPEAPEERRDPLAFVWRGLGRRPPWPHVHAAVTRLGSVGVRVTGDDLHRFRFESAAEAVVASMRNRAMTVPELIASAALPPGKIQLLVYCLLITKRASAVTASESLPVPGATPAPVPAAPSVGAPSRPSSGTAPAAPEPSSGSDVSAAAVARVELRTRTITKSDVVEEQRVSVQDPRASVTPAPVAPAREDTTASRRNEILERAKTVDDQDYFAILGVARDATTQDVQSAYFQLAKVWHPDRLPAALNDARDACSRVFARMSEANQTLADPDRRAKYMRLIVEGGATPNAQDAVAAIVEAATSFQKAEVYMKRGDYREAEVQCKRALTLDPKQADYHAMWAWLHAMKSDNQGQVATRNQIAILDQAIQLNEKCERAYFYRGMLEKRLGEGAAAFRDFKRAAELNPRNVDAQREVRLHQMRADKGAGAAAGASAGSMRPAAKEKDEPKGLFGRLFKKG